MQDLAGKRSDPGALLGHLFFGTFATVESSSKLPWHHSFLGGKVDAESFAANTLEMAEKYAGQVLKEKSDASASNEGAHAG